jgi:hypothetical protein
MSHTPGLWIAIPEQLHNNAHHIAGRSPKVKTEGGTLIADEARAGPMRGRCRTAEANARLIAAAPEMLQTLKDALKSLNQPGSDGYRLTCIAMVEDAIARAERE